MELSWKDIPWVYLKQELERELQAVTIFTEGEQGEQWAQGYRAALEWVKALVEDIERTPRGTLLYILEQEVKEEIITDF